MTFARDVLTVLLILWAGLICGHLDARGAGFCASGVVAILMLVAGIALLARDSDGREWRRRAHLYRDEARTMRRLWVQTQRRAARQAEDGGQR
jgi:hypothetical protein